MCRCPELDSDFNSRTSVVVDVRGKICLCQQGLLSYLQLLHVHLFKEG